FNFVTSFGYTSLDPHRAVNAIADMNWLKPLYDSLLTIEYGTDGLELRPQLAKSFQVSADGRTVSFELRDDVNFQDGTHFNAAAVKANIERAKSAESTVARYLTTIQSVEVGDDTHVAFRLSEPDPSILWAMATVTSGIMVSPAALNTD